MPISDHEELGVNLHARPSSDSVTAVPIKKRRFMLVESPSLPSHVPSSSLPANCDVTSKSTLPESSVSEIGDQPASVAASTSKGSCESRVESIVSRDLNVAPENETLPRSDHQRLRSDMAGKETSNEKELTPGNICALCPVTGSTQLLSTKEPFELPVKEGSGEGKPARSDTSALPTVSGNTEFQMAFKEPFGLPEDGQISEGCSVKKENLDSCSRNLALAERQQDIHSKCGDAESKADSAHLCLNRSNWDLNTTMDTWEGLLTDSAINNGNDEHDRLDLGGMHKKRLGLAPLQILCKEPDGTDAASGKCVLEKSDDHLRSSNSSSMNEGSNSEACLDLQLKSSFVAESLFKWRSACPLGKLDSIKEMPFLSLSVKPLSSSCNPTMASCRGVKAEPNEDSSQVGSRKIEAGGLKSAGLKHVKSEPCEGHESPKKTGPSDLKSACNRAVKSEPLEGQSQGYLRRLDNSSLTSQSMEKSQDVSEHVNKTLQSLIPDFGMRHNGLKMPNTSIPQDQSPTVGEAQELISQAPIPHCSETHHSEKMPVSTGIPQYGKGIVSKSSDLVQESLVSEDKKLNIFKGARKMASESPSESLLSNVKENMVVDGVSEVVAQMCCSDGYNSSRVAPADELHIDSYGKSKVAESSEGKIELSAEALDTPCDHKKESNSSHSTAEDVETVRKQFGDDDDYEDGEVRDPALHGTAEGSCEDREGNQVKGDDSIGPVEVPSCVDLKGDKIENSDKIKIHGSINCDDSQCGHKDDPGISTTSNLHESSADGLLTAGSGKRKLGKTIPKMTRDHLKDKGPERKPKSDRALSARTVAKGSHAEVTSQQENARGTVPQIAKVSVSSKTELSIKDDAKKHANDKGSRPRIVNLKPAPNGLRSGKTKSVPGKLISSQIEKEMLIEKSRSRRIRDEKCKYRSRIFDHERSKDQPVGRCGSDLMHIRSRADNQLNALHGDQNSDHEHVFEKIDGSAGARFPRPINSSEVAIAVTSDGSIGNAGRMARKLMDDELQNLSHMPCRRRSPGGRGQIPVGIPMVRHPIRDFSPSSYIGRDVPDFVLRAHEERLVRTLPDDMLVPPFSRPHSSQYERAEGSLIRRERRSLSPIQRRGPLHFPPICSGSSPRSQARSHPQWSPPRRSPDGFDGPPELISCRSPRTIRHDRMRSHHQRLCFAEDMIVRRRGSPPYIARLPDDVVDIGPSREHDFPRPIRGLHRNIRRFDMIDPRETSEEYFGPLLRNQFGELAGDVECVVDRSCNERRVLGRFRQQETLSDDGNESFRSRVDGGPPGPFRFCPEGNEAFPDTGSPRDSERHIRNRLGSRLRVIEEQEDNYRYHGEAGWRDASSTDVRLKRRRLERHRARSPQASR